MELHHVDPYVLGGEATVDQIALRCRRHNDYEGRLYFGKRRSKPSELVLGTSSIECRALGQIEGVRGDLRARVRE